MRYARPLMVSSKRWTVTAEAALCAPTAHAASERTHEDASTCSIERKTGPAAHKICLPCQNVHKLSTVHPHVFHRAVSPSRLPVSAERVRVLCTRAGGGAAGRRRDAVPHFSARRID